VQAKTLFRFASHFSHELIIKFFGRTTLKALTRAYCTAMGKCKLCNLEMFPRRTKVTSLCDEWNFSIHHLRPLRGVPFLGMYCRDENEAGNVKHLCSLALLLSSRYLIIFHCLFSLKQTLTQAELFTAFHSQTKRGVTC
jgi:hypothetical protein